MQVKIFTIPCSDSSESNDEMNRFLRGNKIVSVEKQFYVLNGEAYWSLCITYLQGQNTQHQEKKEKIDYKEILDENSFARFTQLRFLRKSLAEKDAVPAYAVFTDAELALMSQLDDISESNIKKIQGIGSKRMEKYGNMICEMFNNLDGE
ncbi:MAG: HRDC domain-containing protein [Bacteroidales bacterium]|nr:HRDC domain-containing protein [Bacteroidales bacterium]